MVLLGLDSLDEIFQRSIDPGRFFAKKGRGVLSQ